MIRHIVLYHLHDTAAGHNKVENAALMKEKLESLVGKIEGLRSLEIAPDCNNNSFDVCLNAVFDSIEALRFYKKHPLHVAASDFVHEVMESRAAVDYEIFG